MLAGIVVLFIAFAGGGALGEGYPDSRYTASQNK